MSPSYEQLAALRPTDSFVVGPDHLDKNGHMNVNHYFAQGSEAMWNQLRREVGIEDAYIAAAPVQILRGSAPLFSPDRCIDPQNLDRSALVEDSVEGGRRKFEVEALQELQCFGSATEPVHAGVFPFDWR